MWSFIEINDTLQISIEQGFPKELDYEVHELKQFKSSDFEDKIFEFKNKKDIRIYQIPPVRNFLVQNIDWKWLYWGLVHIIETNHDNINHTTSWKYKIVYIYTPEEMKYAHRLIDRNKDTDFLNVI